MCTEARGRSIDEGNAGLLKGEERKELRWVRTGRKATENDTVLPGVLFLEQGGGIADDQGDIVLLTRDLDPLNGRDGRMLAQQGCYCLVRTRDGVGGLHGSLLERWRFTLVMVNRDMSGWTE